MIHVTELTQLGLTDTEARTYLALLELGESSVTEITTRASITRTLGYHSLKKLVTLRLVEEKNTRPVSFHVKQPSALIDYIHEQQCTWDHRKHLAESLLPKLESYYTMRTASPIVSHSGYAPVMNLYRLLYTNNAVVYSFLYPTHTDIDTLRTLLDTKTSLARVYITDIPDNRSRIASLALSDTVSQYITWISQASLTPSNLQESNAQVLETLVAGDFLYTLHTQDNILCIDGVKNKTLAAQLYTLMYTFSSKNHVSHETTQIKHGKNSSKNNLNMPL